MIVLFIMEPNGVAKERDLYVAMSEQVALWKFNFWTTI
jgi:hypothetical protein